MPEGGSKPLITFYTCHFLFVYDTGDQISLMPPKSPYFQYPPNINMLDLATIVSLYRSRGEPYKVEPGEIIACAGEKKIIKQSKTWFGLHYSQSAWDEMLTEGSEGFPLTEVEFNILGMVYTPVSKQQNKEFIEQHCGIISQMAFMIFSDLRHYEFIKQDDDLSYGLTTKGEEALEGLSWRLYDCEYNEDLLLFNKSEV